MLQGARGSGKTTAALRFLRAGVEVAESCAYVALSQTAAELNAIALSHGWTLDGIRVEELARPGSVDEADERSIFMTSDLRLNERLPSRNTSPAVSSMTACLKFGSSLEIRPAAAANLLPSRHTRLRLEDPTYRSQIVGIKKLRKETAMTSTLFDRPLFVKRGHHIQEVASLEDLFDLLDEWPAERRGMTYEVLVKACRLAAQGIFPLNSLRENVRRYLIKERALANIDELPLAKEGVLPRSLTS
jgi:circadian clock protein KaiC